MAEDRKDLSDPQVKPAAPDGANDSKKGKLAEVAGWLTGDRKLEAKGKLQRLDDEAGDGDDGEGHDDLAQQAELDVRKEYGEVADDGT